jgi:hypothetical protein
VGLVDEFQRDRNQFTKLHNRHREKIVAVLARVVDKNIELAHLLQHGQCSKMKELLELIGRLSLGPPFTEIDIGGYCVKLDQQIESLTKQFNRNSQMHRLIKKIKKKVKKRGLVSDEKVSSL